MLLVLAAALALAAGVALAGPPPPAEGILPVSEVRPGMKGWGLSVFRGTLPERFEVEVLGVLPGQGAGRSMVVVRVGGQGLEESGILQGMSGSPVWIDGRLLGAVSSGWQFSKSPIGGVTPIEEMLAIDPAPSPARPAASRGREKRGAPGGGFSRLAALLGPREGEDEESRATRRRAAYDSLLAAPLLPLPSLLSPATSGLTLPAAGVAGPALSFLGLPAGGSAAAPFAASPPAPPASPPGGSGASAAPSRPVPGGSVSALLVDGDMVVGANGTVTWVGPDGSFVAFGHPFLGLGEVDLALAPAEVITPLPNLAQSFKISKPSGPAAWRLTRDRDAGVAGLSDRPAAMVPVRVRVEPEGFPAREFSFRLANHPKILGPLLAIAFDAATSTGDPTPRERTVRYRVALRTSAGTLALEEAASGMRARETAIVTAATLASLVSENEHEDPAISGIEVDVRSSPGEKRLKIVDAALSKRKAAPGETVSVSVRLRDRRGADSTRVLRLAVPRQAPEGKASVVVADGNSATSLRLAVLSPAEPDSLDGLRRWLAGFLPPTRLWTGLAVPSRGAATAGSTVESLPPTAAALLEGPAGAGGPRAVEARLLSEDGADFDRPLSGLVRLELEIERPRY